ncbi:uncharacterized protein PAE49_003712 isoform 1-T1 [Odontesthes bonariensis]|uniref:uncharacterized protein LOC142378233 isoform X1 n=2 Tax=Odontesthes bonariensis TaxID=219752 RepID=UPI003F588890
MTAAGTHTHARAPTSGRSSTSAERVLYPGPQRPSELQVQLADDMPTSPVKTRIPLTSFGHLITEVKKQLFGIEAPTSLELTGWRKHFNSYTIQGRRNCVLVTYGILVVTAAAFMMHRQNREEKRTSPSTA